MPNPLDKNAQRAQHPEYLKGEYPITVYYEDTDFSGSIYHANYLKYFERAREDLLGQETLQFFYQEKKILFVVSHIDIDYLRPGFFADKLTITTEVKLKPGALLSFNQSALCLKRNQILTKALIEVVAINLQHKPVRLTPELLFKLGSVES